MSLTLVINDFVGDAAFAGFGEANPVEKHIEWRTDVVAYDNLVEQRNRIQDRPRRHWFINWPLIDLAGRNKLLEIFNAARGAYDTFLLKDSDWYLASAVSITTDGLDLTYQLKEDYYSGETYTWSENKYDIVPGTAYAPVVTHSVDGAQTEVAAGPGPNEYTLDDATGIMTWSTGNAPSIGTLSCTYEYYFRVRFAEDTHRDVKIHPTPLFESTSLHIVEVLPDE